jgi:hypothetical protein
MNPSKRQELHESDEALRTIPKKRPAPPKPDSARNSGQVETAKEAIEHGQQLRPDEDRQKQKR